MPVNEHQRSQLRRDTELPPPGYVQPPRQTDWGQHQPSLHDAWSSQEQNRGQDRLPNSTVLGSTHGSPSYDLATTGSNRYGQPNHNHVDGSPEDGYNDGGPLGRSGTLTPRPSRTTLGGGSDASVRGRGAAAADYRQLSPDDHGDDPDTGYPGNRQSSYSIAIDNSTGRLESYSSGGAIGGGMSPGQPVVQVTRQKRSGDGGYEDYLRSESVTFNAAQTGPVVTWGTDPSQQLVEQPRREKRGSKGSAVDQTRWSLGMGEDFAAPIPVAFPLPSGKQALYHAAQAARKRGGKVMPEIVQQVCAR